MTHKHAELIKRHQELNMSNYTSDEVEELNDWAIEARISLQASESAAVPDGCYLSWNGFNLRGDEKSINEASRLVQRVAALEVWMESQQPASAKPTWTTCPDCGYDIARASAKPLPLTTIVTTSMDYRITASTNEIVSFVRAIEQLHNIKGQP